MEKHLEKPAKDSYYCRLHFLWCFAKYIYDFDAGGNLFEND